MKRLLLFLALAVGLAATALAQSQTGPCAQPMTQNGVTLWCDIADFPRSGAYAGADGLMVTASVVSEHAETESFTITITYRTESGEVKSKSSTAERAPTPRFPTQLWTTPLYFWLPLGSAPVSISVRENPPEIVFPL
jgi:opacity protein-like surface antigen